MSPRVTWALIALLTAAVFVQQWQLQGLRADLKNALVSKDLLDKALKARATAENPVVVNVTPAGAATSVPVRVFVDRERPTPPSSKPSVPSTPSTPRLVAEAPPVYCRTKEECDRLYRAAPQAISVQAALRAGTVVPVVLNGQTVNLPLAADVPFKIDLVMSDKGVFHGLELTGSPLKITQVRTETVFVDREVPPSLPYHLALETGVLGNHLFAGASYTNRVGPGLYRVMAGWGFSSFGAGLTAGAFFVLPLR